MESAASLKRFHRIILIQGSVTLLVFATVVAAALLVFRAEIRAQILQRDGQLLTTVAQHFNNRSSAPLKGTGWIDVLLESSQLKGVVAVRLFSPKGELVSNIPVDLHQVSLGKDDILRLNRGEPVTRFYRDYSLDLLFSDIGALITESTYPVTEVLSPIFDREEHFVAVIQYWLDGEAIASELAGLDRFMAFLGLGLLTAGSLVYLLVFTVARGRILKMGQLLASRNRSLEKANADLAMAARTSAIGSVSSHLFHGLKNPLAGLKSYLQLTGHDEEAVAITERMQRLVTESLSVIQDEHGNGEVSLTMEELGATCRQRLGEKGFHLELEGDCRIASRKAQLLLLVLANLVDNARESAPANLPYVLLKAVNGGLTAEVTDHGPGLPDQVRQHLFEPVQSTKENGTGIGLAISSVVASHIPASLDLLKSDSDGTTFALNVPL
ncbi:MAG: sensor histidine kinase [Opitutales bacterium]|jgi:signal transduction histidine kinase